MWWAPIAAAAVGAAGGILGSSSQDRTTESSNRPEWAPEQLPYLFDGPAWNPQMPEMNQEAMNYAQGLMGGFNPVTGPATGMNFENLLAGIDGAGNMGPVDPYWFRNPDSSTFEQRDQGNLSSLLGYGQGTAPPLMASNPFYSGQGVIDPSQLMQGGAMGYNPDYVPPEASPILGGGGGGGGGGILPSAPVDPYLDRLYREYGDDPFAYYGQ